MIVFLKVISEQYVVWLKSVGMWRDVRSSFASCGSDKGSSLDLSYIFLTILH